MALYSGVKCGLNMPEKVQLELSEKDGYLSQRLNYPFKPETQLPLNYLFKPETQLPELILSTDRRTAIAKLTYGSNAELQKAQNVMKVIFLKRQP